MTFTGILTSMEWKLLEATVVACAQPQMRVWAKGGRPETVGNGRWRTVRKLQVSTLTRHSSRRGTNSPNRVPDVVRDNQRASPIKRHTDRPPPDRFVVGC